MTWGGGSSALGDAVAKPRDDRQRDLLRPALEDIIDLRHPLVRLAREIDWQFLDRRFSSVCTAGEGRPPLPTRLVAGLLILKHMHNLADEVLGALAGEPVLPVLLRRIELLPRAAVRPLVIDPPEPVEGGASAWAKSSWWLWSRKACRWRTRPGHWRRATPACVFRLGRLARRFAVVACYR